MLGEEPFLVTSADVATDFAYGSLAPPGGRDLATVMVVPVSKAHPRADFFLRDDRLALEPPGLPVVYGNSGVFERHFFSLPDKEEEQAMGRLLRRAAEKNRVSAMLHEGLWVNVGTPEALAWLDTHGPAEVHA
jgi:MurNAc alpha-1-phosphate uridylyltransferase